jgi:hypothetical protein
VIPLHPAAPSPATPVVPGGPTATNNEFQTPFFVATGAASPAGAIGFQLSIPPGTIVNSIDNTLGAWLTMPTCTAPGALPYDNNTGITQQITCSNGALLAATSGSVRPDISLDHTYGNTGVPTTWTTTISNQTSTIGGVLAAGSTTESIAGANIVPLASISIGPVTNSPATVIQGGNSYVQGFTVTQHGPSDDLGMVITVTAPSIGGVALNSTTLPVGCVAGAGSPPNTYSCTAFGGATNPLPPGSYFPYNFTWVVPASATPANNPLTMGVQLTAQTTLVAPLTPPTLPGTLVTGTALIVQPLAIAKAGPASVIPGSGAGNLQYTIHVTDTTIPLTTVQITDPIVAGTTFASSVSTAGNANAFTCAASGGVVKCGTGAGGAAGPLAVTTAAGDSIVLKFTVPAAFTTPNPILDKATVKSTGTGQVDTVVSNQVSVAVTPKATPVILKTQISPNPLATPPANEVTVGGGQAKYTITLTNNGPSNAAGVKVKDTTSMTGGFTISLVKTSGPDAFSCVTNTCTATGSFPVGTTDTFTATVTLTGNPPTGLTPGTPVRFKNTATVTTTTATLPASTLTSSVITLVNLGADLEPNLTVPVHFGVTPGALAVTFGVTNAGPLTALNPTATLTIPSPASFAWITGPAGSTCTTPKPGQPGVIVCTLGANLANGATATWTVGVFYPMQTASNPAPVKLTNVAGFGPGTPSATVASFDNSPTDTTITGTTTAGSPATPPATPPGPNAPNQPGVPLNPPSNF